jgi:hypothetical protein
VLEHPGRSDHRRLVAGGDARREAALGREVLLERLRVDAFDSFNVVAGAGRVRAEHRGELAVEVDELLGDLLPLLGVGVQQLGLGRAAEHARQLPPEVPGVGHRDVHPLACLGAVGVARVARDEDPGQPGAHLVGGHVVELVAQPLPDGVHRPPADALQLDRVRAQDPVGDLDQLLRGDAAVLEHLLVADVVQGDVEPHQVAALARDDQDVARVAGVDRALEPDVGEVGHRQRVDDAPRLVHRVAFQLAADRGADAAARPVAADDVLGPDRRGLPRLLEALEVRRGDRHRVFGRAVLVDPEVGGVQAVVRLELAGRALHVVEEVGEHPRLVDDHVRHLGEALLDVRDAAGARDLARVGGVRPPERDLVDPVALVDQLVGQAERFEHLDAPARDPVGLAHLERAVLPVDHGGADVREGRQLGREHQTGGAAADDEDVDLLREGVRPRRDRRVRLLDERVTGLVTVEIELHRRCSSAMSLPKR